MWMRDDHNYAIGIMFKTVCHLLKRISNWFTDLDVLVPIGIWASGHPTGLIPADSPTYSTYQQYDATHHITNSWLLGIQELSQHLFHTWIGEVRKPLISYIPLWPTVQTPRSRPGSYFSVPIRPHLVQKRPQVDDLYLKRLEATWAKNWLSTSSRLLTWHSVVYLRLGLLW